MKMIKTKNGKTKIKGSEELIFADFSMIVTAYLDLLMKSGLTREDAKKEIAYAFQLGCCTGEELFTEIIEKTDKLLSLIKKNNKKGEQADE